MSAMDTTLESVARDLSKEVAKKIDFDGFAVFVRNPGSEELLVCVGNEDLTYKVGHGMTGVVAEKGYTWRVSKLWAPQAERSGFFELQDPGPWMGVPIIIDSSVERAQDVRTLGVVRISRNREKEPFGSAEQEMSEEIVESFAIKFDEAMG